MYKGHINNITFNIVRVLQSVEHRTTYLRAMGSNSTVDKSFLFFIFKLSTRTWQVDWSYTNEIKHGLHPQYSI